MVRKAFAKTLKQKRLESGFSQEEFAYLAGLSMRSISLMECGKQQPTLTTLDNVAKALKITLEELVVAIERERRN